jgi:asparagine synthase (glutamine-hydrolysing)
MIAAVLAPGAPSVVGRCAEALAAAARGVTLTASWTDPSTGLYSYSGSPAGNLDANTATAWIGSLRSFSPASPLRSRGDFAFASRSNVREDEILLGRGRFGGRPLYYTSSEHGESVVACSRLGPLLAAVGDRAICADALSAAVLGTIPVDAEKTLYRRIHRVPAACVLRVGVEGVRSQQRLDRLHASSCGGSVDDLARALREQVVAAVERAVLSFNDVSISVSGGIDSSSLLAVLLETSRRAGTPKVHPLNLCFEGLGDDRPYLRALSAALGASPAQIRPRDCAPLLFDSLAIDGAPLGWVTAAWEIRLTQMSREAGAQALLTGNGGDDVFGGDLGVIPDRARQGRLISAVYAAVTLKAWGRSTPRGRIRRLVVSPLVRRMVGERLRKALRDRHHIKALSWAGPRLRSYAKDLASHEEEEFAPSRDRDWLQELAYSSSYTAFADARGQAEVAGGCTRIEPFLDDDLVEFLLSVPPDTFFHEGWLRGLFRHSMRGVIPDEVRMRPDKADFEAALAELVAAAGGFRAFDPFLSMTALADHGLVEPSKFRERFDELEATPLAGHLWLELWPALAAEAFLKRGSSS